MASEATDTSVIDRAIVVAAVAVAPVAEGPPSVVASVPGRILHRLAPLVVGSLDADGAFELRQLQLEERELGVEPTQGRYSLQ